MFDSDTVLDTVRGWHRNLTKNCPSTASRANGPKSESTTFDSLGLSMTSQQILTENGFSNGKDVILLYITPDFPRNLAFIPLMRDRLAVQNYVTRHAASSIA